MEAAPGIEPGIAVLQTAALPLGHAAIQFDKTDSRGGSGAHFPKGFGDDPGSAKPERIDALEYVARVLAQIPPPRKHLVRYHGFYSNAARGKRRREKVVIDKAGASQEAEAPPPVTAARRRWADLLRHVYEVDPLVCPRCAGTMRVVGFITQPHVIRRILDHLRQSQKARPRPPPLHSPPPSASL